MVKTGQMTGEENRIYITKKAVQVVSHVRKV